MAGFVEIDGSLMEGGGQILRMAAVFSALLGKKVKVFNIRGGRVKGGLRPQHLTGLRLVRDLCGGTLKGDEIGSTEIEFTPGAIKSGKFEADCGTAGSITLQFQVSLPIQLFAPGHVEVHCRGGTDVQFAPPIDYTTQILQPFLKKFGANFHCNVIKRGFYPKGQGSASLLTEALNGPLHAVTLLDRGSILNITGCAWTAGVLPLKLANDMAQSARSTIQQTFPDISVQIDTVKKSEATAFGTGCGIFLVAQTSDLCFLASSALGERGVPSERVGANAAHSLCDTLKHGGCIDEHLQDQIIIFMALASGLSSIRTGPLSMHSKTAIFIAEKLAQVQFDVKEDTDSTVISCTGCGFYSR